MKKIVIVAAASLTLAACAKTYELQETAQPQIAFNTWANGLTKARTAGSSAFVNGDKFVVEGFKTIGGNNVEVFDNKEVSTDNGTDWTYTGTRYWDSQATSYTFFAASSPDTDLAFEDDGTISATEVVFSGKNNDILIANKNVVPRGDNPATYFNSYGIVKMTFNHVASLVDIQVKKTPALQTETVTVSAFELNNIEKKGNLSYSSANTPNVNWAPGEKGTYLPANGVTAVDISTPIAIDEDPDFNASSPATPTGSTMIINNLIVKPQTFDTTGDTRQLISITYKIGEEDAVTKELYLSDFDTVDDAAQDDTKVAKWEGGKHYTFYITIDAHKISFEAEITPWVTESGYNYILK